MQSNFARFVDVGKKIVGVGGNFKAPDKGSLTPRHPFFFLKPTSSYVTVGKPIKIPKGCQNLQHEVELGFVINNRCSHIAESDAMNYVAGYVLVLDMTAQDFLLKAQKKGLPWALAKGCDTFTPVSHFIHISKINDPHNLDLWCKVNDEMRQNVNTKNMLFKIPSVISYVSTYISLEPYDLIIMGTPSGNARVKPGDKIECGIGTAINMTFNVIEK